MSDEEMEKKILELSKIPGVGVRFSKRLYDAGYKTPEDLKNATEEDLLKIPGMSLERARTILAGVKEFVKEEIEDEEIERTIREMKKEIAEIEESVERGEEIKFKVVKARVEFAPIILSSEDESEVETHKETVEPSKEIQKKKPKIVQEKTKEQKLPPKKPKICGEERPRGLSRRAKAAIAIGVIVLFLCLSLFLVYTIFPSEREPISIDGDFSDWEGKLFYKMVKDVEVADVNITRVSVFYSETYLYFYVEVKGYLFRGRGEGVDAILIFIDADAERHTGYLVGDGGADYKIEFAGWDCRVVSATFAKYHSREGNDWNAWSQCGNVVFRVDKGRMEGKVKLEAREPRCLFYAKHTDNQSESVFFSDTYVYPQKPSLHVKVRLSGDRVIEKGTSNLIATMHVIANGGSVALKNISLPIAIGQTTLKFPNSSAEFPLPWILLENQHQALEIWVLPSDDLSLDSFQINTIAVDAAAPTMMNSFRGTFYVSKLPNDIQIDGVFQDWEDIETITDSASEELPDSINIVTCKAWSSKSAFFMEVKSDILAGTQVPIGKLLRGNDGEAPSPPQNVDGKDWLKFYIDTSPMLNTKNRSDGIINGYLIKIGGICGQITDAEVFRITNGVASLTGHRVTAAKNETAIELATTFVFPRESVYYFEAESWGGKIDVVEQVQPFTRYYHEENQGSFSSSFWHLGSGDAVINKLCTGDLNNDGKEEVVTVGDASNGKEIIIWKNTERNFERNFTFDIDVNCYSCALGDFDWNGWLDIVVGTAYNQGNGLGKREVTIFKNQNFTFDKTEIFNLDRDVNSVSVIDFNNDGYLDILCGTSQESDYEVVAFTGFDFTMENVANPDKSVWCVDTGYLNDDVFGDLVYTTASNNSKEVGIMSYAGIWKPMGTFGDGNDVRSVKIADFNNDGINDIAFGSNKLNVLVATSYGFEYIWYNYSLASIIYSIAIFDFDNDGFTDIVCGLDNGSLYAFENRRNGTFTTKHLGNVSSAKIRDIKAFDYDCDGDKDLVLASENNLYILNNTLLHRNFELSLDTYNRLVYSLPIVAIATADLDLDGDLDIVTAHSSQTSSIICAWRNPSTAQISPFVGLWERYDVTDDFAQVYAVACGDVDNDGYPEIVFSAHNGSGCTLCVATSQKQPWKNNWTWDWEGWYDENNTTSIGEITQIALGDMNRDGKIDVVSGDTDGWLVVYKRGNDSITDSNCDWLDATAKIKHNRIYAIKTEDIDRDGWIDIVCGSSTSPGYAAGTIKKNLRDPFNGSGWQNYSFATADSNITSIEIGDFNQDSYPDIASVVNGTQCVKVFMNPKNLSNPWEQKGMSGVNVVDIATGDVNNNYRCDLVIAFLNGSIACVEGGSIQEIIWWNTAQAPLLCIALANLDKKSTYDGNDLDLIACFENCTKLYKNRGANVKIECFKLGSSLVLPGETKALLMLNLTHTGITGDNHVYLSKLSIQFLNYTDGRIMAPDEMSNLFENVSVWLDEGTPGFDMSTDRWLAACSDYGSMQSGFLRISLVKSAHTSVAPLTTKSFFITVKLKTSIPPAYNNYSFGIGIWCNEAANYSWNAIYDYSTSGIATVVEGVEYYSDTYSVGECPGILCLFLFLVIFNAMYNRKLRRKTF